MSGSCISAAHLQNPRSSRTVPYISKVTGIPSVRLATRCMLGEKLKNLGYGTGLYPHNGYIAVKVPVFSFEKLHKRTDIGFRALKALAEK